MLTFSKAANTQKKKKFRPDDTHAKEEEEEEESARRRRRALLQTERVDVIKRGVVLLFSLARLSLSLFSM